MTLRPLIALLAAPILLSACGPIPEIDDYDRACEVDADCVVVFLHRDCDCNFIGAVHTSEDARVRRDNDAASASEWCPSGRTECDVAAMEAKCEDNLCRARAIPYTEEPPGMDEDMSQEDMSQQDM